MKVRRFLLLGFAFFLMLGSKVSQAQSECELNYSLYREYFKQWKQAKYNPENLNPQMITSWRYVFNNCPDFKQRMLKVFLSSQTHLSDTRKILR